MRRIVCVWVLVAALAGVLVGLASAAHPRAAAPVARAAAGSTCFVGTPSCSESPCVEFVAGAQPAVVVGPGVPDAKPITGCRGQGRRPGPATLPAVATASEAAVARPARPPR